MLVKESAVRKWNSSKVPSLLVCLFSATLLFTLSNEGILAKGAAKPAAKRPAGGGGGGSPYPQCLFKGSQVVRWIPQRMPLKVYITHGTCLDGIGLDQTTGGPLSNVDNVANWPFLIYPLVKGPDDENSPPNDGLKSLGNADGYNEQLWQAAAQGIGQWKRFQNEGLFTFELTDDPQEANVFVFWTHHFVNKMGLALFSNDIRGYTSKYLLPYPKVAAALNAGRAEDVIKSIRPVVVVLRTTDQVGANTLPMPPGKMVAAAAHEMGHVLGIDGHSPNRTDLMSIYYGNGVVSANDAASIRYIYHHNPDLTP